MLRYALATVLFATPAMADPERYGHMMDWGYGYGMGMFFGPVLWILILGLVVAGIIWLVRKLDHGVPTQGSSTAMKELDMRLARGEIDAEDYSARKKLLGDN